MAPGEPVKPLFLLGTGDLALGDHQHVFAEKKNVRCDFERLPM